MDRSELLLLAAVLFFGGMFLLLPTWLQERREHPGVTLLQTGPNRLRPGMTAVAKMMILAGVVQAAVALMWGS